MTAFQVLCFHKVLKVFIVNNDLDCILGTFKVIAPILEGFHNCKKFLVISIIIVLNPGKLPGPKRHQVPILLGAITSLVLL